jgi:hypothetical protein
MQRNFINMSLCQVHEASIIKEDEETFARNEGRSSGTGKWPQFSGLC